MRKNATILLLTLIISTSFISCKFSRPFCSRLIKVDTIISHDTTAIQQHYNYFRISHYGLTGAFNKTKEYTDNNVLILISYNKQSTNRGIKDGRVKHKSKYIKYKNDKICEIGKRIRKTHGIGCRLLLSKTFLFDDNGKLIKRLNNKKDKNKKSS